VFARADESAKLLLLRRRAGGATTACGGHRPPLLETLAAVDWAPLRGLERNRGFLPALRAHGLGLDALNAAVRGRSSALRSRGFARLAPLGLVLEALVGEKHLLAGGEDKLRPTVRALQDLVMIFHGPLRGLARTGQATRQAMSSETGTWGRMRFPLAGWHEMPEETLKTGLPNPAHAAAFCGGAYARGRLLHDAAHRAS
jgi:hypothetical protein